MNLNQLRYVKAVADTGSFTLAAERCCITQPTLSSGIAQLEDEFGEKIFSRTTRIVFLTAFGQHILPYIEKTLDAQTELLRQSQQFNQPTNKIIRIGVSPIIDSKWLIMMIELYRNIHPDNEIILFEHNMSELYRMLDSGILDFVFGVEEMNKAAWNMMQLYQEPLYFIPRTNCANSDVQNVIFNEIADETFVMVPNVCGLATTTRSLFRKHRKKLKEYSGEAFSYQVLEEWAALGLGAAILPKSKLKNSKNKPLMLVEKSSEPIYISMVAYWINHHKSDYFFDFIEYLSDLY